MMVMFNPAFYLLKKHERVRGVYRGWAWVHDQYVEVLTRVMMGRVLIEMIFRCILIYMRF